MEKARWFEVRQVAVLGFQALPLPHPHPMIPDHQKFLQVDLRLQGWVEARPQIL